MKINLRILVQLKIILNLAEGEYICLFFMIHRTILYWYFTYQVPNIGTFFGDFGDLVQCGIILTWGSLYLSIKCPTKPYQNTVLTPGCIYVEKIETYDMPKEVLVYHMSKISKKRRGKKYTIYGELRVWGLLYFGMCKMHIDVQHLRCLFKTWSY